MSDRKETPDLMGDLLGDDSPRPPRPKPVRVEKVKSTYYLSPSTNLMVDRIQLKLREMTGRKVSKSEVIAAAISHAYFDLEERGGGSDIARDIPDG